jgi:hypothetical protein
VPLGARRIAAAILAIGAVVGLVGCNTVAAPTITSFAPTSGPTTGGTTVIITGTNLTGASAVTFGTTMDPTFTVTSATTIKVKTEPHLAGTFHVAVITPGGRDIATTDYTFVTPVPTITSFTPTSGSTNGGTTVTITGTNLTGASAVKFGTATATIVTVTSTTIRAKTRAHAAGAIAISVTTPGGTTTSATDYKFVATVPTITAFTPTSGPTTGGTTVTVSGTNLTGASAVKFGTTPATSITVTSATTIKAKTKAHAAGTVAISVTTAGSTATSTKDFRFVAAVPTITTFSPTSGPTTGGTTVTLTGTALTAASAVKFGTTAATSFTVTNPTTITADTKAHAAATVKISVTTAGGTATSATDFKFVTVQNQAPYTYAATSPKFNTAGTGSLSFTTKAVGDLVAVWAQASGSNTLTSITDTNGRITWRPTADLQVPPGSVNSGTRNIVQWHGVVLSAGTTTIETHWSRAQTDTFVVAAEIASHTGGTNWSVQAAGYVNSSVVGTATDTAYYPALASGSGGGAYIGSGYLGPTATGGATSGFTYKMTSDKDVLAFDGALTADTMYAPTFTMTAAGNYMSSGVIYATTATPFPRQVINSAVASANAASITVTFPSTTAGTDLVAMVTANAAEASTISAPAGWARVADSTSATVGEAMFVDKTNPGGITSATFTRSASAELTVIYLEAKGVGTVDVYGTGHLTTAATTLTVTTSSTTTAADELAVLAFAASPGGIDPMSSPWPPVLYQMQTSTDAGGLMSVDLTGAKGVVSATDRSSLAARSTGIVVVFKAASVTTGQAAEASVINKTTGGAPTLRHNRHRSR